MDSLDRSRYEAIDPSVSQFFFFYLSKCLACNTEKNITVKNNKKRMNIANFINIYTCIYIEIYMPMLYVTRMTQNKNDSRNSILQHYRDVDKNCCVVFPTS